MKRRRAPRRRSQGLGQAHLDFNTRDLHEIGLAALDVALPGALAAAEEAQEDGFDSTKKEELLEIVSGPDVRGVNVRRDQLDVSEFYEEPRSVGIDLVRELEDRGFRIVRER